MSEAACVSLSFVRRRQMRAGRISRISRVILASKRNVLRIGRLFGLRDRYQVGASQHRYRAYR